MKRGTRKRNTGRSRGIIFAVLMLLLAALLLMRILRTGPGAAIAEEMPAPTVASAQTVPPKTEETEALPEEAPVPEPTEAEPIFPDEAGEKPTPDLREIVREPTGIAVMM